MPAGKLTIKLLRKLCVARQRWSNWRGTDGDRFSISYRTNRRSIRAIVADRTTHRVYNFELRRGTTDLKVFEQTWVQRQYDLSRLGHYTGVQTIYERMIASGQKPLILDLGANCGVTSSYFKAIFADSEVVAIEPEECNYRALCANTNQLGVRARRAAVGSFDGYAEIDDPGQGQWAFRTLIASEPTGLPLVSVPTLLAEHRSSSPFLMKIDIEGAEKEIFSGDTHWIELFPIIAIELHDWMLPGAGTSGPFLRSIAALDRDFVVLGETVFSFGNSARAVTG